MLDGGARTSWNTGAPLAAAINSIEHETIREHARVIRRLIICCDGTWNAPEINDPKKNRPTNVLKLCRAVVPKPSTNEVQVVEYLPGIGTHDAIDRYIGGMSGWGISRNIQQAYQFLVNNYVPGDEIYLFGFSRGAYTARSLSGFIELAGLIKKEWMHVFPAAYRAYRLKKWEEFNERHGGITHFIPAEVRIHFLGVWDTVGSLGAPTPLLKRATRRLVSFHSTGLAANVTHAYQALALHEVRAHFKPALWTTKHEGQKVEQVWFPGAHSDVGGGLENAGLSDAALEWMMDRANAAGLKLDQQYRKQFVRPASNSPIDISLQGQYWPFLAYVRPISEGHLDSTKPVSLEEYIHASATARLKELENHNWRWLRDWRKKRYFRIVAERASKLRPLPEDAARIAHEQVLREQEQAANEAREEEEQTRARFEKTQDVLKSVARPFSFVLKRPPKDTE